MASAKSRLGRGLGALISSGTTAKPTGTAKAPADPAADRKASSLSSPEPAANGAFREIPVHLIEPNPFQPRKEIAPEQLAELAESIRSEGLLQPVVVRAAGEKFQLIAGERRWRAFQLLKLKVIPVRVMEASDASSASLALIENLQREGLNPIEEAFGFSSLIRDFDLTQEAAAERVGRGRASVANSLRLLQLEGEIQGYLAKGLISTGHAKAVLGLENPAERLVLARRIIEEGMSVRHAERWVQNNRKGSAARTAPARIAPAGEQAAVAGIEKKLASHLGARVSLRHAPRKGRIVIEYHGNDDLQRLLERLGVDA